MSTHTSRTRPATGHRDAPDAGATVLAVRVLGVLAAVTGVEHGVGEIAQGSIAPPGTVFESWPDTAAFDPVDGEPAMSVVPDLLASGVLSVVVALALGAVAVWLPRHRYAGPVLLALAGLLLLIGGGFGPPLVATVAGLLATRAHATPRRPVGTLGRRVSRLWPWPLWIAAGCFLGLFPGTTFLGAATDADLSGLVGALTVGAFAATALTVWSARARDRLAASSRVALSPSSSPG